MDLSHVTMSSDGQGSLPMFDKEGKYMGLGVGRARSLLHEIKACVLEAGLPLETVLPIITRSPAELLKLKGKGVLEPGASADLNLLKKETLEVDTVLAKGRVLVRNGKPEALPTFHLDA